ncbi:hypothetical protein EJ04DRAFT_341277 [Polyplosphaeria fusca]|uniref:Secreted protein n=1 Tax=Polyplosphaeria fusca TaxID=682080 RepID=A0A9P4V0H8_9PLEO|nr:hypothetical protein EJ04DRAFT_341277 [Polyplosphaeria fusca]
MVGHHWAKCVLFSSSFLTSFCHGLGTIQREVQGRIHAALQAFTVGAGKPPLVMGLHCTTEFERNLWLASDDRGVAWRRSARRSFY